MHPEVQSAFIVTSIIIIFVTHVCVLWPFLYNADAMQAKIDPYACLNLYAAWRMSGSFWLGEQQESQRMIGDVKILQEKYLMSWYVSTFSSPMLMLKNRPCSKEERLIWTLNGLINIQKKRTEGNMSKHFFKYLSFTRLYEKDRLMLNCSCWTDLSSLVWKWTRAQCVPRYTCQLYVCN